VIVCAAPNPSIDKLFEVERLDRGRIHRPTSFVQVAGGKGLNVARTAATLGADVHVVALLGGYHGRWIAVELERLGIALTAVWYEGETRSCLSVADADAKTLTEFYEDGPPVDESAWKDFASTVAELSAAASWLTLSGSLPRGIPPDGYAQLVDTGNVALDSRMVSNAQPQLVKVNAAEAFDLTGTHDVHAAAHELRRRAGGAGKTAVVTQGRGGAFMVDPDGREWRGTVDASGPYPVGSGDAFLAGLVVALERGAPWPDALRLALGSGAANAEVPGAGRLDRRRAEALAERAAVTPRDRSSRRA
jgi:1-phosphofructokinase family hexose kinase